MLVEVDDGVDELEGDEVERRHGLGRVDDDVLIFVDFDIVHGMGAFEKESYVELVGRFGTAVVTLVEGVDYFFIDHFCFGLGVVDSGCQICDDKQFVKADG